MNAGTARERGAILLLATLALVAVIGFVLALSWASVNPDGARRRATESALAEAREALIAYATARAIDPAVGPGYLPCPDLDNDGWAEATCGSLSGELGQDERLGRLPWKTLGIADLRDGDGERLWYAVSTKYKGLLNCAASAACIDMSPEAALGTITVRDSTGAIVHDGTIAEPYRAAEGGAVAVVIAPGAPLMRVDAAGETGRMQSRACGAGDCDERGRCLTDPPQRAASCDPANYLDKAPAARFGFEDNAHFTDRGADGFIQGPVTIADGRIAVNDRVSPIGYRDVMPRLMRRVALEVAVCIRDRAAASGHYPSPVALCAQPARSASTWAGVQDAQFGRVADEAWDESCSLASDAAHSWWKAWRENVFYARLPGSLDIVGLDGRLIARGRDAAVIVAGPALVRDGFVQQRDDASMGDARQWLEGTNALLESARGCALAPAFACEAAGTCTRITQDTPRSDFNDAVLAIP
jgi:type II secretory pathway pseudopilin PulG